MKEKVLVGLDIGTSGLKITLADAKGRIKDHLKFEYQSLPEQQVGVVPVSFYEGIVKQVLTKVAAGYELLAIAVTTQMYSICEKTSEGILVWQWNSLVQRSKDREKLYGSELLKSGCPVDTIYGGYKWFAASEQKRRSFLPYGLKECLIKMLTGQLVSDYTTASASGWFDLSSMDWNHSFLEKLGCASPDLPKVIRHNEIAARVLPEAFEGASGDTVVVPGLGDGPAASYACKDVSGFCGNVGTSMACRVFTSQPDLTKADEMWIYGVSAQPKLFIAGGISSNGCTVFHWGEKMGIERLDALRDTGDLMFLPWINGERMPYWSSDLRGTFLGLTTATSKEDIACVMQKAVSFTLATMIKKLEPYKKAKDVLVLAGGGINSQTILTVTSGCIDSDIAILEDSDYLCSTGAVISAGEAVGIAVEPHNKITRIIPANQNFKKELDRWQQAGECLANLYQKGIL